jgi:hypothetical protein
MPSSLPLPPETRLGPYLVVSPLGAGVMGEVYRATDAKLGRDGRLLSVEREVLDAEIWLLETPDAGK